MTKTEKAQVVKALVWLAAGLDREFPDVRQEFYLENLKGFPVHAILSAIRAAPKHHKFFPTVAELLELVGQHPAKTLEQSALEAWESLCKRGRCGDLTGQKTWKMIAPAGYIENFDKCGDFKRKEFISLYAQLHQSVVEDRAIPQGEASKLLEQIGGEQLCQD